MQGVRVVRLGGAGSWMDSLQLLCSQDCHPSNLGLDSDVRLILQSGL